MYRVSIYFKEPVLWNVSDAIPVRMVAQHNVTAYYVTGKNLEMRLTRGRSVRVMLRDVTHFLVDPIEDKEIVTPEEKEQAFDAVYNDPYNDPSYLRITPGLKIKP